VQLVADQQLFGGVLQLLGVRDKCTFIPSQHFYRAMFPNYSIDLPGDREGYVETHVEAFPHEADNIRDFWELCRTVHREAHDMPVAMQLRDLDSAVAAAPTLFKYRKATLAQVLDERLTDERAKAVCGVPWQYLGVPPSKASFQTFAQLTTVHTDDLFAIEGGVEQLIDALALSIRNNGGEILTGRKIERILVEGGRAVGVRLAPDAAARRRPGPARTAQPSRRASRRPRW
jgi:prolycopene isomerase